MRQASVRGFVRGQGRNPPAGASAAWRSWVSKAALGSHSFRDSAWSGVLWGSGRPWGWASSPIERRPPPPRNGRGWIVPQGGMLLWPGCQRGMHISKGLLACRAGAMGKHTRMSRHVWCYSPQCTESRSNEPGPPRVDSTRLPCAPPHIGDSGMQHSLAQILSRPITNAPPLRALGPRPRPSRARRLARGRGGRSGCRDSLPGQGRVCGMSGAGGSGGKGLCRWT